MGAGKPVSETEIVNLALLQLHQGGVTSVLDDNDPAAVAARRTVAPCRRALLRNHPWNFAVKRAALAKVSGTTPAFDYQSYYQLPNDLLRLLRVGKETDIPQMKYDIEGRYIAADSTDNSLNIKYIRDVEDVTLWDAMFVEVMVLELAVRLCQPLTGDRAMQRELRDRLSEFWREAVSVDHQERPLDVYEYDGIAAARANSDFIDGWPTISYP